MLYIGDQKLKPPSETLINPDHYDTEIEYLEGTGTQWIDTNISGNTYINSLEIEVKFLFVNKQSKETCVIGAKNLPRENIGFTLYTNSSNQINSWVVSGSTVPIGQLSIGDTYVIKVTFNKPQNRIHVFNGITSSNNGNNNYTGNGIITLFMDNVNGTQTYAAPGKIKLYYCKVKSDNTLLIDAIPVRIGQVGYMYNKVSGKLFGNKGTGNFVLGPDKT